MRDTVIRHQYPEKALDLSYCDSPHMGAAEAYIEFTPGLITEVGEVTDKPTEQSYAIS
jgi:hypothetical protein